MLAPACGLMSIPQSRHVARSDKLNHESFHLNADAADIYESQKVVAIFRPLALATIGSIGIDPGDQVIDVACGTGIVSRVLEERHPDLARIVGVDLNPSMIEKSKSLTSDSASRIEWYQSDVAALPFQDHSFSLAICQQGLQYFPQKETALSEIRRVVEPGGRLALTVWSGASPLFVVIARALGTHINEDVARRSLTPFSFNDQAHISSLIRAAGFSEMAVTRIVVDREVGPASHSIPREIASNPIASEVESEGSQVMKSIVESVDASLADFRVGDGFIVPQESFLFTARS